MLRPTAKQGKQAAELLSTLTGYCARHGDDALIGATVSEAQALLAAIYRVSLAKNEASDAAKLETIIRAEALKS